jgi:hypothetical protein
MTYDADSLASNFIHEYGRESLAAAFHLAAKCLEHQDYNGYELYLKVYVRLVQRSGMARTLSLWYKDASEDGFDARLATDTIDRRRMAPQALAPTSA